ncbi:hypothetical protein CerSpe_052870 [Prunus speciosa]
MGLARAVLVPLVLEGPDRSFGSKDWWLCCQLLEAELWGLFFGLNLVVEKKVDEIVIEMGSETAVLRIHNKVLNACHPNDGLVSNCKRLMNLFRRIKLQHIYRERNDVADGLGTWRHNLDLGCYYLEESFAWLGHLLLNDSLGAVKARLISSS